MKKIIIILMMLIGISINVKSNVVAVCDRLNIESVSNYLNLKKDYNFDKEQLGNEISLDNDSLSNESYKKFCRKMRICNKLSDKIMRKHLLYSGITEILDDMYKNLDKANYRQFLMEFNLMMYNHGFLNESSEYCDISRK